MEIIVVLQLFIIICLSLIAIFLQREIRLLKERISDFSRKNSFSEAHPSATSSSEPLCPEKECSETPSSGESHSMIPYQEDEDLTPSVPSPEVEENDMNQPTESVRDKELFERINQTIIEQQLFLDPEFSREKFIRLGLINKNKVGQLLQQYANTNLNGYINNLRLEYALELIRTQPDVPVKAVAIDSGFNNARTFYRLFQAKYGKTPAEYKDSLHDRA